MMTTVASIEKIWMPNKKREEKVLNHGMKYLWDKGQSFVYTIAQTTNQPLSEAQSLMLHQQLSCYVHHTAQGRCKTALPLSCFIDFTQLLRKNVFSLFRENAKQKYNFGCIVWKHHHGKKKISLQNFSKWKTFSISEVFGILLPSSFCFSSLHPAAHTDFLNQNKMKFISINSEWGCFVSFLQWLELIFYKWYPKKTKVSKIELFVQTHLISKASLQLHPSPPCPQPSTKWPD